MGQDECKGGGPTKSNSNCTEPGPDGRAVQCVGPWAKEKHDYLRRYVDATRGARGKYLTPAPGRQAGGAAFIDLFAGPGRARVRTTGEVIDGSPLIAALHEGAAFTKLIFVDKDDENVRVLGERLKEVGRTADVLQGDCNTLIDEVVRRVPSHGLNIALLDPFGLRALSFDTIAKLAQVKRMDILLHFPTMDIKRNFTREEAAITRLLGTDSWKARVTKPQQVAELINVLREQLGTFGYSQDDVRSLPVENEGGGLLYHLVYATKAPLGNKIWQSIARIDAHGQRTLL